MKVSIVANGYYYTEYIQKTKNVEDSEPVSSPAVESQEKDFAAQLKDIQDLLIKRNEELSEKPEEKAPNSDYESIAPEGMVSIFEKAASTYGLDQKLLELIAQKESNFKADAKSSAGAMGVMQLMPATAESLGVTNAYDPEQNIMGAAKLLKQLWDKYNGELELVLAGYNAGTGAVEKYGGVPPYEETKNYIAWIKERYTK